MDLPTPRELELETLLRQRDAQLADLTDEVVHLRQYLSNQPAPVVTDPISLPPPLVSLLLPHINDRSDATSPSSSSTVTAALTQRVKVLQEENDELYEILKTGETGRLKEDVRSLRRVVQKLEGALRDSHQVITSLSDELDKAQTTIVANGRTSSQATNPRTASQSPLSRVNRSLPPHMSQPTNGKLPPTGPRAHKKPRLSETPSLPPTHSNQQTTNNRSQSSSVRRQDSAERSPRVPDRKTKMETDDDDRGHWSPDRSRDYDRERDKDREPDRDRERERDRAPVSNRHHERPVPKERERDRRAHRERNQDRERDRGRARDSDRSSKRNGAYGGGNQSGGGGGGGGGRRPRRGSNANSYTSGGDRTLRERMGL
ncbi:hypothetical protein PHLGIDRAFT_127879 [Phlebiopsis gigantea 11061_1 CR5-6]|uniref:Uncharacterized protein n=1 Tax=Phlebiopsis gigantea (strain 11061_1 CR5-6) TaxID=745531 RepID=A0A0C3PKU2_PHLG1|nr:hypothetical protein PHLGIDRAFT_127879 [Phlebiopsis gigantea 11061_1 CR5-6]